MDITASGEGISMGFGTRRPTSNDDEVMDEFALLLNGFLKRCGECRQAVKPETLVETKCESCRAKTLTQPRASR